jgi:hypothetical protein
MLFNNSRIKDSLEIIKLQEIYRPCYDADRRSFTPSGTVWSAISRKYIKEKTFVEVVFRRLISY